MPKKRRKDGLVEKKITIGRKPDGTPKRKTLYAHSERELREKEIEYLKSTPHEEIDKKITLSDWADKWLYIYKANLKPITFNNTYKSPINNHIKPFFQDLTLASINPMDIQNFANHVSSQSQSIVDKCGMIIKAIFKDAIKNKLIIDNPTQEIKFISNKISKEKRAYSVSERDQLISFAKEYMKINPEDGAAPILALFRGLGRAELLALEWDRDINFKNKTLTVNRSVSEVNGNPVSGLPKTKSRKATLSIDDEVINILKQIPRKLNSPLVFSNKYGKLHSPSNWSRNHYDKFMEAYNQYCQDKNLPEPRLLQPHELRHTFGSIFYRSTKDIYLTSKVMRHSSVDITAKVYIHEDIDDQREGFAKMM